MTTEHINEFLDHTTAAARVVRERNKNALNQLIGAQRKADEELVDSIDALATAARGVTERHRHEGVARQEDLDEASRVAGVAPTTDSTDAPAPADTTPPPAPEPTEPAAPATATATAVAVAINSDDIRRPSRLDCRNWQSVAWLFAIIGAIIGAVIASNSWSPLVDDIRGFGRGLLATCWWIGLTGLGFFGGGAIGATIEDS